MRGVSQPSEEELAELQAAAAKKSGEEGEARGKKRESDREADKESEEAEE
jgi:protein involved in temperature-dependent protein secretion